MSPGEGLEGDIDEVLARLGFELVVLERGGGHRKENLRLRIDRRGGTDPDSGGVSVQDCARVSRTLHEWLAERRDVPRDYDLEVSSPGVERPLVRPRDYDRFAGREVRLKGYGPLHGDRKILEGELIGLEGEDGRERVLIRFEGERIEVPLESVATARLVYRPEDDL
jgi:ribosome maturation factor RimP